MKSIRFHENQLTGTIPDIFQNFSKLEELRLNNNLLTGQISHNLWNITSLKSVKIHENNLNGSVSHNFCDKIRDWQVDDSKWFVKESKVKCSCCINTCYVWLISDSSTKLCPPANTIVRTNFPIPNTLPQDSSGLWYVFDKLTMQEEGRIDVRDGDEVCLSPTGCYFLDYWNTEPQALSRFQYSYFDISSPLTLTYGDYSCYAVKICEDIWIDSGDPRRIFLNHITQLSLYDLRILENPTTPQYKALCFLMKDDFEEHSFEQYDVCDGTFIQRYALAVFMFSTKLFDRKGLRTTNHTCSWHGIVCDVDGKFVEQINLPSEGLEGNLVTEIGLLQNLKLINLYNNSITGSIEVSIFASVGDLEVFNMERNQINGGLENLLSYPKLRVVNVAGNVIGGVLPSDVQYPTTLGMPTFVCSNPNQLCVHYLLNNSLLFNFCFSLETLNTSNNLMQGPIPNVLLDCSYLQILDISNNAFDKGISSLFGELKNLRFIHLNNNKFTGSLASELFNLPELEELCVQSNKLTGSIPTEVGFLQNLRVFTINHNEMKGTIPKEFETVDTIKIAHFHNNKLIGTAPEIKVQERESNSYISDCGFPNYDLQGTLECEECTMCCNSDEFCQVTLTKWSIPIWGATIILSVLIPIICSCIGYILLKLPFFVSNSKNQNTSNSPSIIYNEDSIYLFILSSNKMAIFVYFATVIIQIATFGVYLQSASMDWEETVWEFSYYCPDNSLECVNQNFVDALGWTMFGIVLFVYHGADMVTCFYQIKEAVTQRDLKLFLSGFILCDMTILSLFTSTVFNWAVATKNTDVIMNVVILFFVNDMDEKVLSILYRLNREWIEKIRNEVEGIMSNRYKINLTRQQGTLNLTVT